MEQVKTEEVLVKDSKPEEPANVAEISYFKLFTLSDKVDVFLITLGIICGVGTGIGFPISSIFLGELAQAFDMQRSPDAMIDDARTAMIKILILGAIVFVLAAATISLWTTIGKRLGVKFRVALLKSVLLEKDVTWFDTHSPQELPTKLAALCLSVQTALGSKIGVLIISVVMGVAGLVIGFMYGWQLSLSLLGLFPIMGIATAILAFVVSSGTPDLQKAYARSGAYAEESLTSIRTVMASCSEKKELENYTNSLTPAKETEKKIGFYTGLTLAIFNFSLDVTLSLGYYIGSFFIEYEVYNHFARRDYRCEDAMIVFYSMSFGFFCLGQAAPCFKAIREGTAAGTAIFRILEDDISKKVVKGEKRIPEAEFKGEIEFKGVDFRYPSNPSHKVLTNLNMQFVKGKTTAICGDSGCGKSTIFQLIEGFYYADAGEVFVDGVPIRELDTDWLRGKIGFVGQEPVLFNTSIRENIKYGNDAATDKEIMEVCKKANCYELIMRLPKGLDTVVGVEGSQLSGGEKQRIALARAIIRKPKILLLDEATSALDRKNEAEVQRAIKNVSEGITTIVVAHRLSTIKDSDNILVLRDGTLMEQGKHQDLLNLNKIYASMYSATDPVVDLVPEVGKAQIQEVAIKIEEETHAQEEVKKAKDHKISFMTAVKKVLGENKENKRILIISLIISVILGFHYPIIGALNGAMFYDLLLTDYEEMRRNMNLELIYVLITALISAVLQFFAIKLSANAGAEVSHRTRVRLYEKYLSMHVGWFDEKENTPSRLCNILYEEAKKVNSVLDTVIGFLITSFMSSIISIAIAFYFDWRMALIVLVGFPLMLGSGLLDAKLFMASADANDEVYLDSLRILSESVRNIRTVLSFGGEKKIIHLYEKSLENPLKQAIPKAIISGVLWGLGLFIQYAVNGVAFYFGAIFIKDYDLPIKNMFISFYTIVLTSYCIGQSLEYCPDVGAALEAISTMDKILSQTSDIVDSPDAKDYSLQGKIEFKNVTFFYPNRKYPVLRNISFTISPGQKVGIVGISGSGKSTIIQLIERFYDIQQGDILFDNTPIKHIKISSLRKQLGLVSQEPVIFDRTIADNIGYTLAKSNQAQVEEASKKANAFVFIQKFPEAFERKAGPKGNQLSGGQKQRIAIARAVIKEPSVMLLDEATSALDNESEELVQKGLNESLKGKTSLVIAHRLSTVQDSHKILVLENGRVIEEGTREELIGMKGRYYQLETGEMGGSS